MDTSNCGPKYVMKVIVLWNKGGINDETFIQIRSGNLLYLVIRGMFKFNRCGVNCRRLLMGGGEMKHKMHYMSDCFEIWLDVETDKTETEIYEIIRDGASTWEIYADGQIGFDEPIELTPTEIITQDLERAGAKVIDCTEALI
jgi:hypothetical protein